MDNPNNQLKNEIITLWQDPTSKCYLKTPKDCFFHLPPSIQKQTKPKEVKELIKSTTQYQEHQIYSNMGRSLAQVCVRKTITKQNHKDLLCFEAMKNKKENGSNFFTICGK